MEVPRESFHERSWDSRTYYPKSEIAFLIGNEGRGIAPNDKEVENQGKIIPKRKSKV